MKILNLFGKKIDLPDSINDQFGYKEKEMETLKGSEIAAHMPVNKINFVCTNGHLFCFGHHEILNSIEGVNIGEDMALFSGMGKSQFLVNIKENEIRKLTDISGKLVGFDEIDFDNESLKQLSINPTVSKKIVEFGLFPISQYHNGICALVWKIDDSYISHIEYSTVYRSNYIYGIFDSHCNLLLPWQTISDVEQYLRNLYKINS